MKIKDLIKSPWYIATLILCALLACTLFFVIISDQSERADDVPNTETTTSDSSLTNVPDHSNQGTAYAPEEITDIYDNNDNPSIAPEVYTYFSESKVKENVLLDALLTEGDVDFILNELNESEEVPFYEVVFETKDKYRKYIYKVNAFTGLLRSRTYYNADDIWDEGNIFMKHEGKNAKWYDEIWEKGIPDGKRGSQSFYNEPIYTEE